MASVRKRGTSWYVRYRDERGKQVELKAGPDRGMAKRVAAEVESRVRAIKAGVLDPREKQWADAERIPLVTHVQDWADSLTAKGRTPRYAELARNRVLRLIGMARASRLSHLSLSGIQAAVGDLRSLPGRSGNVGLSDRSVHHHVRAIGAFTKWLWRDRRVREDPLAHLSPPTVVHRRRRRALSLEDAARLITTTRTGPVSYGLSGADRAACYALALGTGFRADELRSLVPEDFALASDPPAVTCRAAYTKNRTEAVQPIRRDLAELLRTWVAGKPPGVPVLALPMDTAKMVRRDLARAGIPDPETYDFHGLRHTFVTHLVRSGTSIKVVQALARHADPAMTLGVYTHVQVLDLARGLDGLPSLTSAHGHAAVVTGTYGHTLAHTLPTPPVSSGRDGAADSPEGALKLPTRCVPRRQPARSTEPKVRGSNPLGCICVNLRQFPP
ncbi:MAG: tyrosine-type recombinase/integrase [Planctomycetaceae bacterium]|nr:tyrosine-type recombinase/integrase [Planctomycetaceae bacterium]